MVNLTQVPAAVDAVLAEFFQATDPTTRAVYPSVAHAGEVLRDFVLTGGKRVRPMFVYAGRRCAGDPAAADGDPTPQRAERADGVRITVSETRGPVSAPLRETLRVCAAIELIQACALVHDDILDRSDTRRGHPTVHRRFEALHRANGWDGDAAHYGESAAILVGDLALAWADDLFHGIVPAAPGAHPPPTRPVPVTAATVWAQMRTEVLGGQFLDITNEASGDETQTAAERVMEFKTAAYTVARPLELGAALGGADEHLRSALHAVGIDLGVAFQLRDDLLGVFGDPAETGKPSGDDLIAGKRTSLLAVALRRADERSAARLRERIGLPLTDTDLATARSILVDSGAVAEIEQQIAARRDAGLARIDALPVDDAARTDLRDLAHRITSRRR